MTLNQMFADSVRLGYRPSVRYMGGCVWRAHWNTASNAWGEGDTPVSAMGKARQSWMKNPDCAGDKWSKEPSE